MRHILFILLGFVFCMPMSGQKELKTIKRYLKDGKARDAMSLIYKLEKDTTKKKTLALYAYGKEAQLALHQIENEKNYLNQKYDTVAFFNTTMGIIDYILKYDSLECLQEGKSSAREENRKLLCKYYPNLNAGGRWFFKNGHFEDARKFLKKYIDIPTESIWGINPQDEKTINHAAYLYLKSSFFLKDYQAVFTYKEQALADSALGRDILETLVISAMQLGDTVAFKNNLKAGVRNYPKVVFFFTHLADYYNQHKEFEKSLALADTLLVVDPENKVFMMGKSLSLMNLKEFEQSIEISKKILDKDSTQTETYFNIGACYCNLAKGVTIPTNINSPLYKTSKEKVKTYYKEALQYLETYRALKPKEIEKWAPLLYRVYLNLNMGEQFEEMDQILQELHEGISE